METQKNTNLKFLNEDGNGRCVCLDPGRTTGCAIFFYKSYELSNVLLSQFLGYTWLPELQLDNTKDIVIIERLFIPRNKAFYDEGIRISGAVEMVCESQGITRVVQEPSVCGFIEKRYRKYLDDVKFPIHSREAMYHGVKYLRDYVKIEDILNFIRKTKGLSHIF